MHVALSKTFRFEAAHALPTFPPGHKCRRLHGHGFEVEVRVQGEVDETRGYLIDYNEIKAACESVVQRLDHQCLNEVPGLENPTAENLARWIWEQLKPRLALLSAVVVRETPSSSCEYQGT